MSRPIPDEARFARQLRFSGLGAAGQERLAAARVALVGCGALGGVLAQCMHRAGVGQLVLIDRDVVEASNLPRQVLFDESHAQLGTPKVEAAAESLARAGGPTELVLHACHLDAGNADELLGGAQLVLDGSDNMATRYLLNDWCVRSGLPWVYAGVVGAAGCVLPVLPGRGACLRCLWPEEPPTGSLPTCDSAGVVLPGVAAVASMAAGDNLIRPPILSPSFLDMCRLINALTGVPIVPPSRLFFMYANFGFQFLFPCFRVPCDD